MKNAFIEILQKPNSTGRGLSPAIGGHESTRASTFLEEPVAQTWQCLQQPVEVGVKVFTKTTLLKLGFHFKSSLCSHHFLHETS